MKNRITTKSMVKVAMVAAIYTALTCMLAPISFGSVQFRLSEIMVFLSYFNPIYIAGLTIGCFIANMLSSPYFILDGVFGTLATLLSCVGMYYTGKFYKKSEKGLWLASIWPVIFNGVIVGITIYISITMGDAGAKNIVLLLSLMGSVAIGEFGVVTLVGAQVARYLIKSQKAFIHKILE